eukprot:TRINITY_DN178_c0_g1_i2.p1 TRINITY_DN178_c0_g1~~TRINITY_DN178_c0_g1_i2.p1  ORF type:complete len:289 (-),score=146.00 TRINITY_DN178_c0_g1_i2:160-933(-)
MGFLGGIWRLVARQGHGARARELPKLQLDRVRRRGHSAQRRRHLHVQRDPDRVVGRGRGRRRNNGVVAAVIVVVRLALRRVEALADRCREREPQVVALGHELGQVREPDRDRLARGQVADADREDIRALLLGQVGAVARRDRAVIGRKGLRLALDLADDRAAVDLGLETAHGGLLVHGGLVHGLHRVFFFFFFFFCARVVLVGLGDGHARKGVDDRAANINIAQREARAHGAPAGRGTGADQHGRLLVVIRINKCCG